MPIGGEIGSTYRLTDDERAVAARFAPQAEYLAKWYAKGKPERTWPDIIHAAGVGLCNGVHTATRRFGRVEPDPKKLRAHLAANVIWQIRTDAKLNRNRIKRRAAKGFSESYIEDGFEGGILEIPDHSHERDLVEARDFAAHAHVVIEQILDDREKQVLRSKILDGESLKTIGQRIGVSRQTVCLCYHQAISKLRAHFGVNKEEN